VKRRALRARGIVPRLARRGIDRRRDWATSLGGGTHAFGLNRFRRLKIRYERNAEMHLAFLELGCALICWRFL